MLLGSPGDWQFFCENFETCALFSTCKHCKKAGSIKSGLGDGKETEETIQKDFVMPAVIQAERSEFLLWSYDLLEICGLCPNHLHRVSPIKNEI